MFYFRQDCQVSVEVFITRRYKYQRIFALLSHLIVTCPVTVVFLMYN